MTLPDLPITEPVIEVEIDGVIVPTFRSWVLDRYGEMEGGAMLLATAKRSANQGITTQHGLMVQRLLGQFSQEQLNARQSNRQLVAAWSENPTPELAGRLTATLTEAERNTHGDNAPAFAAARIAAEVDFIDRIYAIAEGILRESQAAVEGAATEEDVATALTVSQQKANAALEAVLNQGS